MLMRNAETVKIRFQRSGSYPGCRNSFSTGPQVKNKLEQCSVTASSELVVEEQNRPISCDSSDAADHDQEICAVRDVGKAINTFYAHKLFKFDVGMDEFHDFLSALCRYKNVKDAEHLLFCNENVFPYDIKSFNIILNGWSSIIGNPREAKRVWREMSERGIAHDVISYSSIISCYSKFNNLHEVLKLLNQMKEPGIFPDRKVYNAVIHALAKGKRLKKDACNMLRGMEEKGIAPSAVTYNSLIKPLCRARQLDEAQEVFHEK
ncbi:Pentatricopeptide repeat-containing protein [Actinidia chinensis var. chinensis]|uniref:Pentatricopeptide repeat-containing protein n=1 Tax=Actinidia chinensis var. chinensis TaxID=1590841 RepID=A0A2R6QMM3_ACTCC|nr:Pentatricopeptide repeat-containing protein [Actinidia chinensis var. chinensis]